MSDTKWTPGPWVIDPATRPAEVCTIHGLSVEKTDGQGWAYVRGELGYWGADHDEQMANAHLIAAAPELYEALTAFERAQELWLPIEVAEERAGEAEALHALRWKMLAALAKARGES